MAASAPVETLSGASAGAPSMRSESLRHLYEAHEERLKALHATLAAEEAAEKGASSGMDATEALMRELFVAKFELAALQRTLQEAHEEATSHRRKNDENIRTLHNELRRTHEAMYDVVRR